jgi:hypothetical protein
MQTAQLDSHPYRCQVLVTGEVESEDAMPKSGVVALGHFQEFPRRSRRVSRGVQRHRVERASSLLPHFDYQSGLVDGSNNGLYWSTLLAVCPFY